MTRRRNKSRKPQPKQRILSQEIRQQKAFQCLKTGCYREAVTHYKELLKLERRQEWIASLAEAYHGRAQDLTNKGMFKEAVAIWRNRAEVCSCPLSTPFFFRLLLGAGQTGKAVALLQETRIDLEQQGVLPEVREQFAALAVAGAAEALDGWPADDPLTRDCPTAMAALEAYCERDDERLHTALSAIPFRSPFRDLRQILKALHCSESDIESATEMLARVPETSPFIALARAAKTTLLPDQDVFSRLPELDRETRAFVAALKGWPTKILPFCHELLQLGSEPNPEALLRFLLRHRKLLDAELVRQAGCRILIYYPKGRSLFARSCGALTPFERACADALHMEEQRAHPREIVVAWSDAVTKLEGLKQQHNKEAALSAALILRHMVEYQVRLSEPEYMLIPHIEQSLEFDPEDRASYIRLIQLYRKGGRLKEARHWLERALACFPENVAVLEEAVETALAGNAYKKAAGLAARILDKDPINQRVRSALIDAHLAHARKQIGQTKLELAAKELDTAFSWVRTEDDRARVALVQGVLLLNQGEHNGAETRLKSGEASSGGGLAGRFCLLIELVRMKHPVPQTMKRINLPKPAGKPSMEDVLRLIRLLNDRFHNEKNLAATALNHLTAPLRRAANNPFHATEADVICDTWGRFGLHDLRCRYAKSALKQWRNMPVFVYHKAAAEIELPKGLTDRTFDQLMDAEDRAHDAGEMVVAQRIRKLLDQNDLFAADYFDVADFPDSDFDGDMPDIASMIEMIMGGNPSSGSRGSKKQTAEEVLSELTAQLFGGISGMDDDDFPFEEGDFDPFAPAPKKPKRAVKKKSKAKPSKPDQQDLF